MYQLAGCTHPAERLWIASLTDASIKKGWSNLRPGAEYDPLADAARCRGEADWLVGLNATRAMTCLVRSVGGQQLLSVGRVQTPTLAMLVKRDAEIENFKPETFWQVKGTFGTEEGASWQGAWFAGKDGSDEKERDETAPKAERVHSKELAELIASATSGQPAVVQRAVRKQKKEKPPLLYDLTSLQRRANQRYGLSAQQTLDLAQALYERHKIITYPRTDARYITDDQVATLPTILEGLCRIGPYEPFAAALLAEPIRPGKRVVNAAEVGDHHAILPTGVDPSKARLSPDEKRIFDLVARRFMAALSPDAVVASATIIVAVDANPDVDLPDQVAKPLCFRAKGRVVRVQGWRAVDPPGKSKERELPNVEEGDRVQVSKTSVHEGKTRPPRPHNDASILRGMETAGRDLEDDELKRVMRSSGLGTPATRASIIQTLITRQYAERQGKDLRSTSRGRALIAAVPVAELKSAELTGQWEARLSQIADGKETRPNFMRDVVSHVEDVIAAIRVAEPPPAEQGPASDRPELGTCPICEKPVREGRGAYSCDSGRACTFVVFKTIAKRAVSKRALTVLLKGEQTKVMKGFRSKKGKDFSAALTLNEEGRVSLVFPDDRGASRQPKTRVVGHACPVCSEGRLIRGRTAWGCGRWREGVTFGYRLWSMSDVCLMMRQFRCSRETSYVVLR